MGERDYNDGEIAIYDATTGKLIHGVDKAGLIYTLAISAGWGAHRDGHAKRSVERGIK